MLRVGVMLESLIAPAWVANILAHIEGSDSAELSVVICRGGKSSGRNNCRPGLLFGFWQKIDRWLYGDRLRLKNANEFVAVHLKPDTPVISQTEIPWVATELGANEIARLDVLLDFSDSEIGSQMTQFPKFGYWSIGSIPANEIFEKMMCPAPLQETGFEVQRANEIFRVRCALFANFPQSLHLNRNQVCWRTSEGVIRCLEGLDRSGWSFLMNLRAEPAPVPQARPSNARMIVFLSRFAVRVALEAINRTFFHQDWFIAYGHTSRSFLGYPPTVDFNVVRAPRTCFYADPIVVEKDGRTFVFFEDYLRGLEKGVISYLEVRKDGSSSAPERVLETSYHLSYPCVFEWRGEMYMIPESIANHTVELYRATDFPRGWQLERVLFENVSFVDSTIFEHDGKFWLFACGTPEAHPIYRKTDDELFLYLADTPLGPWTPHPMNPIVCDVRGCRPAGRLFYEDGVLIRPSQDCSEFYGHAVTLNRIETLTETGYKEIPIATIGPGWFPGNLGTHTYDRCDNYQVMDGRTWIGSRMTLRPRSQFVQHIVSNTKLVRVGNLT